MVNENLKKFFKENKKVALGFSGGVDSSYLLYAGIKSGADIKAYFIKSAFQPEFELEDARRVARELNANMEVIELDLFENEKVLENPKNRCYFCKQGIFSELISHAKADGYSTILDGTNASDEYDDRPGMKALIEMEVKSPLREASLTKSDVRMLSKEAGLFTWEKPSYACLATRIPTGRKIEKEDLFSVEMAEDVLFKLGFKNFRVRVFHDAARIQIEEIQMDKFFENIQEIYEEIKKYFKIVLLDLEVR